MEVVMAMARLPTLGLACPTHLLPPTSLCKSTISQNKLVVNARFLYPRSNTRRQSSVLITSQLPDKQQRHADSRVSPESITNSDILPSHSSILRSAAFTLAVPLFLAAGAPAALADWGSLLQAPAQVVETERKTQVPASPSLSAPELKEAEPGKEGELLLRPQSQAEGEWRYSQFLAAADEGKIDKVLFSSSGTILDFRTVEGTRGRVTVPQVPGISTELAQSLGARGIDVIVAERGSEGGFWGSVGSFVAGAFPLLFLIASYFLIFGAGGGGGNPFGPGGPLNSLMGTQSKFVPEENLTVRFDDVAGCDAAKQELVEVVDFLKFPEKYTALGAKIPKGCLLAGPPGTGKTLLARAVAGEAGVPFISCSASEFVEVFVGLGASRVRDLFEKAKEKAPCIIFIDELDAVGRKRGAGMGGGNDEREQTINQLLTELDGFSPNAGVIVLAATNRPDILDPALLRPGRFDRQVTVDRPDFQGRIKILQVHSRNKKLGPDVDLEKVARRTPGFTGADLQNVMNEAAILAARRNLGEISKEEVADALERMIAGVEKKGAVVSEQKRRLVAFHEAGHALVGALMPEYDAVEKISIIPRGSAGGLTYFAPSEERLESGLYSKRYLESQLAVALGGRVAEEIVFGREEITTGAANDLQQVTRTARQMVEVCGFSKEIGQVALKQLGSSFLGDSMGRGGSEHSLNTTAAVDREVAGLVATAEKRARGVLETNVELLHKIADLLLEKETVDGEDLQALFAEAKVELYVA